MLPNEDPWHLFGRVVEEEPTFQCACCPAGNVPAPSPWQVSTVQEGHPSASPERTNLPCQVGQNLLALKFVRCNWAKWPCHFMAYCVFFFSSFRQYFALSNCPNFTSVLGKLAVDRSGPLRARLRQFGIHLQVFQD